MVYGGIDDYIVLHVGVVACLVILILALPSRGLINANKGEIFLALVESYPGRLWCQLRVGWLQIRLVKVVAIQLWIDRHDTKSICGPCISWCVSKQISLPCTVFCKQPDWSAS
jgi:hypothetical protein